MQKRGTVLYNVIFPIWLIWIFPLSWIVVLPMNYLIDRLVIKLTQRSFSMPDVLKKDRSAIWKVWGFGFLSDLIGAAALFCITAVEFASPATDRWWYDNITNPVSFSPFTSVYALFVILLCTALSAFCIYIFNYSVSFRKSGLDVAQRKRLALNLALFTAPYLFFLPTAWIY